MSNPRLLTLDYSNRQIAGVALFLGTLQFVLAMNLAEQLYPNYSVSANYISDLGATCTTTCTIVQPSSTIFNSSVIILGLLILVGAYFINREFHSRLFTVLLGLTTVGAVGVGVFPETTGILHVIVSFIVFFFGSLSALSSFRVTKKPFNYFSVVLGILSLIALGLFFANAYLGLGPGGMERMIAYPDLLWGIALGGNLMHSPKSP